MKSCFYQYRKGLFEKLGTLGYNVYQHPPKNAVKPYILIGGMNAVPQVDNTVYSQEVTTEIHVVNEYFGDQASNNSADTIMNEVMQLLISMGRDAAERSAAIEMDDFEMTPNQLVSLADEVTFDDVHKEVRLILNITAIIDQKLDVS